MDFSLPGSSGIFQARILEWVAISSSRGFPNPGTEPTSLATPALAGKFFTTKPPGKLCVCVCVCVCIFYHVCVCVCVFLPLSPQGRCVCVCVCVCIKELDHKESWAPKNWCFWTVVLEKILESSLDCKEIQRVHPEGDQSWVFIGRTDAEAETPVLWPAIHMDQEID